MKSKTLGKIRVVHHSNQLGLGGTEKNMQLFCKYLDQEQFEVYALSMQVPAPPHRIWIDSIKAALGHKKARERTDRYKYNHVRLPYFVKMMGQDHVRLYTLKNLHKVMQEIQPHILHVHHSGEIGSPLDQLQAIQDVPMIFTINGFGVRGQSPYHERINKILFPSYWVKDVAAPWSQGDNRCGVLYCPTEKPYTKSDLRAELGIAKDIFVVGRVGRNADDIHDPISLKAYQQIENDKTLFLVLAPPPIMKRQVRELGIKRILYLEPTVDDVFLSKFYNTINVLAHARLDGETFGCNIAEAMIHGKPVVTHRSYIRNAQLELVNQSAGFVVDQNDDVQYAQSLRTLMNNKDLGLQMGAQAGKRALEHFEAELITKKLEKMYIEELRKSGL